MSSVDLQHSKRTDVSEPKQMSLFYVVIPLGNIIEKVRRCEDQRKIAVKTDRKNKPCTPYLRPKPKDQEVKTMRQCTKCKVTKEYSEFYKRHAFCKGCHKIYNAWTRLKKINEKAPSMEEYFAKCLGGQQESEKKPTLKTASKVERNQTL